MTRNLWVSVALAIILVLASRAQAENGEDCTTFCNPRFGPGVGVTCQAALSDARTCLRRCFYENGYWFDGTSGAMLRSPHGTGDQRPQLTQVPPYGYPTLYGYQVNTWLDCPGGYSGRAATPRSVYEWCSVVARSEYREGEAWCSQYEP